MKILKILLLLMVASVAHAQVWQYFSPGPSGQLEVSNGTAYLQPATRATITNLWASGTNCTSGNAPLLVGGNCSPLILTAPHNSVGIGIMSLGVGTDSYADLLVQRASSTADTVAAGANVQLTGTMGSNVASTILQNSGGQTELWQFNSGLWNEILRFNPQRQMLVQAPASGPALTVNSIGNNESVFAGGSIESIGGSASYTGISATLGGETSVGGSFQTYLGLNWHYDGNGNWVTGTDGGSNGGSFIGSNHGAGDMNFFAIPANGGTNQTIANSLLPNYLRMTIGARGNITMYAPTAGGSALTVNGAGSTSAAVINSGNAPTVGTADFVISRNGSQGNQIGRGPSIDLNDVTNSLATLIQNSGGQSELWQFNSSTWHQIAFWDSTDFMHMDSVPQTTTAQTGFLCWAASGGLVSYNSTGACQTSSARYKQDIEPLDEGLSAVMKLRPVEFHYKAAFNPGKIGQQVGFIAEEVAEVDSRLAPVDAEGIPYSVEYQNITALLARAIQDQQHEIRWLWAAIFAIVFWNLYLTVRPTK